MPDIAIARMFRDFGIATPGAQKTAREALSRAGIISSRPNRTAIASEKVDRAREALETAFLWHCGNGDCRRQAEASRSLLVDQAHCTICGGSKDRSSLEAMASALVASNVSKVLVVGGTEAKGREIRRKVAARDRVAVRGRHEVEGRPLLPARPPLGGHHRHLGQHRSRPSRVVALRGQGRRPRNHRHSPEHRRACRSGC